MKWKTKELGEFAVTRGGSVNPAKYPDEVFDLLSIPAFDAGIVDVCRGKEIGSSKKCVEPNDVLVSKIVPHIRRCWIVPEKSNHRQIASGEWIQFRTTDLFPEFMRHFLVSDPFHSRFMQTISGVGGSLLRARPAEVYKIQIPLPPLAEQKRIAGILDAADALRAKRRESLAQLDTLLQSTFLTLFGDPVANPMGWPTGSLGEVIKFGPQNGLYKPSKDYGSGTRILRIDGFYDGLVTDIGSLKRVRISEKECETYGLAADEIVINRVNSRKYLGKCAIIPSLDEPTVYESNMMRLSVDITRIHPRFLVEFLQTQFIKNQILTAAKDAVNQSSINQKDIKSFQILVPPLDLQNRFAAIVESVERQKARQRAHLAELDALFASLQSRAFSGEL